MDTLKKLRALISMKSALIKALVDDLDDALYQLGRTAEERDMWQQRYQDLQERIDGLYTSQAAEADGDYLNRERQEEEEWWTQQDQDDEWIKQWNDEAEKEALNQDIPF